MDINRLGNNIRNKMISKALSPFGFGQIQDAMNIIAKIKSRGISIDGFMDWGRYMQLGSTKSVHQQVNVGKMDKTFICPGCGLPLMTMSINTEPCNIVGENYKTLLYCYDDIGCGYELYSENSIEDWAGLSKKISSAYIYPSFKVSDKSGIKTTKPKNSGCGGCGKK